MFETIAALSSINVFFEKNILDLENDGLNSEAGIVLFYFYYSNYSNNDIYRDKAFNNLQKILNKIDNGNYGTNFFNGISGIGWMIDHLSENDFIDTKINTTFSDFFDDYFHQRMIDFLYSRNFDYQNGALGFGFYFIKKYKNAKSKDLKLKYCNLLSQMVFFFERERIYGFKEIIPDNVNSNNIEYDKEIQISNLINFLLLLVPINICKKMVFTLLISLSNILLKIILHSHFIKIETVLCLWKSGDLLKEKTFEDKANLIFKKNLLYEEPQNIINYFRIFKAYEFLFKITKIDLYNTLQMKYYQKLLQCFSSLDCSNYNYGLWNGLSGIGLSIMTLENNFSTDWDDCLIMK